MMVRSTERPTKALRDTAGKPDLSYLLDIPQALEALARVFEQGAIKYERGNWKLGGKPDEEYLAAALRHITRFRNEGYYDPDIGSVHLANALWNLAALIELNYSGMPTLDPTFDQEAFQKKYGTPYTAEDFLADAKLAHDEMMQVTGVHPVSRGVPGSGVDEAELRDATFYAAQKDHETMQRVTRAYPNANNDRAQLRRTGLLYPGDRVTSSFDLTEGVVDDVASEHDERPYLVQWEDDQAHWHTRSELLLYAEPGDTRAR